jgi:hypothetical protein
MKRTLAILLILIVSVAAAPTQRIKLNAPRTFWLTPTGIDQGYDCLQSAPCASWAYALSMVQNNYDLAGQNITFNACGLGPATYAQGPLIYGPQDFIGHSAGPAQILLQGDPANPGNCVINPTSGNAIAAAFGASFTIDGFTLTTLRSSTGPYLGADALALGHAAAIAIKHIRFGNVVHQWNDITCDGCRLDILTGYDIAKDVVITTANFAAGNTVMVVASTAGLMQGMVATGPGIPQRNSSILAIDPVNRYVWMSGGGFTANVGASPVYFIYGGQTHMDVGNGGVIAFGSNCGDAGGASKFPVTFSKGWAGYYDSFIHVAENASVTLGAAWQSANVAGDKYSVHTNGTLHTCGDAIPGQGITPSDTGGQVL